LNLRPGRVGAHACGAEERDRRRLLDHPLTARKIHARPVPRLGGIAIVAAFFLPPSAAPGDTSVGLMFRSAPLKVVGLFAGGLAIAALGIYDDVKGASPRAKLAVQLAVGLLMYALGYRIDEIANPSARTSSRPARPALHALWFAGVVNAMNLTDGPRRPGGGRRHHRDFQHLAVAVLTATR
jgi:UDP-GlcNAc:undecaprenyl-phosphate GlcNAc-1-phosphate transferase